MRQKTIVLSLLCFLFLTARAFAGDTASISVTVSLESVISVSVTPNSWGINSISLGSTTPSQTFEATVGNTATQLEIKGSDANGGWVIGNSADSDQFKVNCTDPALSLLSTYQVLDSGIAAYGSKSFGLTYSAPTTDTKGGGVDQSFIISLKASAP